MSAHGRLNVDVFIEPTFMENAFLLWCDGDARCWIIDPGFPPAQTGQIVDAVRRRELTPAAILLTHAHVDHIAGIAALRERFGEVAIVCPRGEEHMLADTNANLSAPLGAPVTAPAADRLVAPGDELSLSDLSWSVLDVAGHSPAGVAYHCRSAGVAFVGDAVFADSIGRYDFPHSSRERLLDNIRRNLLSLPDETVVYSGHGPQATIEHIRRYNQVLRWELEGA